MTILLAIESSGDACSVALSREGQVTEKTSLDKRRHNELILPMIDALLVDASVDLSEVDAFAFSCGPGSFTGIRIAASVVQGLALGVAKPVLPISSLACLAQAAYRQYALKQVVSVVDARMNEIYWGAYSIDDKEMMSLVRGKEIVCLPENAPILSAENYVYGELIPGVGSGSCYASQLEVVNPCMNKWYPDCVAMAGDVLLLAEKYYAEGKAVDAEQAIPVYLRESINWKKLPGRG